MIATFSEWPAVSFSVLPADPEFFSISVLACFQRQFRPKQLSLAFLLIFSFT